MFRVHDLPDVGSVEKAKEVENPGAGQDAPVKFADELLLGFGALLPLTG